MRSWIPLVFLTLLTTRLAAQDSTVQANAPSDQASEVPEETTAAPWRTSYFPYLSGGSNDGPLLNFRVRYWQAAEYEDRVTANAALNAEAGITSRGSRHIYVQFKAPQMLQNWRFQAAVGAVREVRFGYFGLGNDAVYDKDLVTDQQPFLYRVRRTRY